MKPKWYRNTLQTHPIRMCLFFVVIAVAMIDVVANMIDIMANMIDIAMNLCGSFFWILLLYFTWRKRHCSWSEYSRLFFSLINKICHVLCAWTGWFRIVNRSNRTHHFWPSIIFVVECAISGYEANSCLIPNHNLPIRIARNIEDICFCDLLIFADFVQFHVEVLCFL